MNATHCINDRNELLIESKRISSLIHRKQDSNKTIPVREKRTWQQLKKQQKRLQKRLQRKQLKKLQKKQQRKLQRKQQRKRLKNNLIKLKLKLLNKQEIKVISLSNRRFLSDQYEAVINQHIIINDRIGQNIPCN